MKKIVKSFAFFDIFKYKFYLRVGNTIQNSTFFSIAISILLISPLLVYFFLIAKNTWQRTAPKIIVQEYDVNERPYMKLTQDNFRLGFRIILQNGSIFHSNMEDYFSIYGVYNHISQNSSSFQTTEHKIFPMEKCKRENFKDFETYYDLNLELAICLTNHSMNIGGYFDESNVGMFQIVISFCNSSVNINCKSQNDIITELQGSYIYIYIESQDVEATNYKNPLKKSMKTYFQLFDFYRTKALQFYMEQVDLVTYDNLVYNNDATHEYFNKQFSTMTDSITMDKRTGDVIHLQIFASNKIQTIQRTYMTLLEAAAVVGGISSFLLVFGTFITFQYNDMRLQTKLINKLYSFDFNDPNKIKKRKNDTKEQIKLFKTQIDMKDHSRAFTKLFKKSIQINQPKLKSLDSEPNIPNEMVNIDEKK